MSREDANPQKIGPASYAVAQPGMWMKYSGDTSSVIRLELFSIYFYSCPRRRLSAQLSNCPGFKADAANFGVMVFLFVFRDINDVVNVKSG